MAPQLDLADSTAFVTSAAQQRSASNLPTRRWPQLRGPLNTNSNITAADVNSCNSGVSSWGESLVSIKPSPPPHRFRRRRGATSPPTFLVIGRGTPYMLICGFIELLPSQVTCNRPGSSMYLPASNPDGIIFDPSCMTPVRVLWLFPL
jgi:hypothetical protein